LPNILITAAGGPGAVNMTRSLLKDESLKLYGCDASPFYVHLALTHERSVVPRCSEREPYLKAINTLCRQWHIDLIMPNNSLEAHVLSSERDRLDAGVLLPPPETLDIANSKWRTYEVWREHKLPVPRSTIVSTRSVLRRIFAEYGERPIWIRGAGIPGKGIGGAALPCKSFSQAEAWIDFYEGWGAMMASEYLPGENLTWIGLWNNGQLITSQGRERLAYIIPHVSPSGVTGAPAISRTVHRDDLNTLAPKASLAIDPNLTGVSFLDFKCDKSGSPRLTEINAGRFGTTHHFYSEAGLNLPVMLVDLALGRESQGTNPPKFDPLPADLFWVRTLDAGPVLLDSDPRNASADV
jgi:carbamoylphosphate synthase large subunit